MDYAEKLTTGYYVVKTDEETLGRFRILTKAKTLADNNPGSIVYAPDGAAIYTAGTAADDVDIPVDDEKETTEPDENAGTVKDSVVATVETSANPDEKFTADEGKIGSGSSENFSEGAVDEPVFTAEQTVTTQPTVAYAKLKTLMNIRTAPNLTADKVTVYRKGVICEVLEVCENDWLKIRCPESPTGIAYVSNEDGQFAYIGKSVYKTVTGDSLRGIAEKQLGNAALYMQIRALNGLTSNTVQPNTVLLIP